MMAKTIYLAGPIAGKTYDEANDWRNKTIKTLAKYNIIGISPLRCEPLVGNTYNTTYEDPKFGTPRAIASKNLLDVRSCDMTLCYLPKVLNKKKISLGTIIELAWAFSTNKPTILVSDYDRITEHPVVQANSSWVVPTLDEAIEIIVGVFSDYTKAA